MDLNPDTDEASELPPLEVSKDVMSFAGHKIRPYFSYLKLLYFLGNPTASEISRSFTEKLNNSF